MLGVTVEILVLGIQEVMYARKRIFEHGYMKLFKLLIIDFAVLIPVMAIEFLIVPKHVSLLMVN